MDEIKSMIRGLGIDERNIKPCSPDCCHYAEGCCLGYPLYVAFNGFGSSNIHPRDLADLRLMYSAEFAQYWQTRNPEAPDIYLPCNHEGCAMESCQLLDDERFMSRVMRSRKQERP